MEIGRSHCQTPRPSAMPPTRPSAIPPSLPYPPQTLCHSPSQLSAAPRNSLLFPPDPLPSPSQLSAIPQTLCHPPEPLPPPTDGLLSLPTFSSRPCLRPDCAQHPRIGMCTLSQLWPGLGTAGARQAGGVHRVFPVALQSPGSTGACSPCPVFRAAPSPPEHQDMGRTGWK